VSLSITLATAVRVLRQLRRDPRTIALVLVVPAVLLTLFRYVFDGQPETFDRVGAPMVGIFPLISMFLVTSIAMLRERTTGTLERLMSLPLGKGDLLAGYALAFALVVLLAVANAVLGMALGLFLSAFASTEFQAVQFMPAVILPQLLLCGLLVPRDEMAEPLQWISAALPMTYAYDALARATAGEVDRRLALDVAVVLGSIVVALALGAATLRRRTP